MNSTLVDFVVDAVEPDDDNYVRLARVYYEFEHFGSGVGCDIRPEDFRWQFEQALETVGLGYRYDRPAPPEARNGKLPRPYCWTEPPEAWPTVDTVRRHRQLARLNGCDYHGLKLTVDSVPEEDLVQHPGAKWGVSP